VRDHFRQSLRCKSDYWDPQLIAKDASGKDLNYLFDWLEQNNVLKDKYHVY
jgi:hypothetical protein